MRAGGAPREKPVENDVFERLLAALHDAALDDVHWPAAHALLDQACGTRASALVVAKGRSQADGRILFARFSKRGGRDPDCEQLYFDAYYPLDERIPRLAQLPDGRLAPMTELYTDRELKTSAVYNDLLYRGGYRHGLNLRLDGPQGSSIVWTLADSTEPAGWGSAQVEALRRLFPHLRHFVGIRHALAGANALGASFHDLLDHLGTGVVHLDRRGRIVETNDRARSLLVRGNGLRDQGGFLRAWLPADDTRLQGLVAAALPRPGGQAAGGAMLVRHPCLAPGLTLHVHPATVRQLDFGAPDLGALVLIAGLDRPLRLDAGVVGSVLGLTPAESRVAVGLAAGRTVPDIAAACGRAESSVRTHIKRIHRKLRVSRRADLVRLVLSAPERAGFLAPSLSALSGPGASGRPVA